MSLQQRLTVITLGVKDLQRSKDFYTTQFGWKPVNDNNNIIMFLLNGFILSLFPSGALADDANVPAEGAGFRGFTLAYNVTSAAEVDALFERFAANGVTITRHAEKAFWGGYRGYVADPDNYLWEICWNPYMELDAQGSVTAHQ
ncbi:MAG TPA: VOC family protein [Chitinophaga sp.]|uniref:VOC family protein n=1 Tax=Chitinophaga sp. TaxID=1869181 RepID=UPI002DBACD6D|nr:VOC family protein [Chitinophaga sp.]HEU4552945.1 VOC family protein [Chitinophaga sp.]